MRTSASAVSRREKSMIMMLIGNSRKPVAMGPKPSADCSRIETRRPIVNGVDQARMVKTCTRFKIGRAHV